MIIFDFSQLAFSSALEYLSTTKEEPTIDLLRHLILNSLRAVTSKHRNQFGPRVVIAMDGKQYWRRTMFPHYKAKRKIQREQSGQDWKRVFDMLNPIKEEFKQCLPYFVLQIDEAEADDIIGILTMQYAPSENILIVSSDKDFLQLHHYGKHVKQYSPAKHQMISSSNPTVFLKEQILRGDTGDGIPNVLSPSDVFVSGGRQKPMTEKRMNELMRLPLEHYEPTIRDNYHRNELLIDLTKIPESVAKNITQAFQSVVPASKENFLAYLIIRRCKELISRIDEF